MFRKRKLAKQLAAIGSHVDTSFLLYLNNEQPITFSEKSDCISYIKNFRENNEIFKIQIFRIETYSL